MRGDKIVRRPTTTAPRGLGFRRSLAGPPAAARGARRRRHGAPAAGLSVRAGHYRTGMDGRGSSAAVLICGSTSHNAALDLYPPCRDVSGSAARAAATRPPPARSGAGFRLRADRCRFAALEVIERAGVGIASAHDRSRRCLRARLGPAYARGLGSAGAHPRASWAPCGNVARPAPHHGHRQRHARQLLRRRQLHAAQAAIDHGLRLADEGADILDIGGESTRPGSDTVPLDEELRRVIARHRGAARQDRHAASPSTRARPRSCAGRPPRAQTFSMTSPR